MWLWSGESLKLELLNNYLEENLKDKKVFAQGLEEGLILTSRKSMLLVQKSMHNLDSLADSGYLKNSIIHRLQ